MARRTPLIAAALMAARLAHAAPPPPEAAQAAQTQLQAWVAQITMGMVQLPADAVQLTAEDDHYRVTVPLAPWGTPEPPDAAITATVRPLGDGRWQIDDQRIPSPLRLTVQQLVPDSPDAKDPSPTHTHMGPVTYSLSVGEQSTHGIVDPAFATPSNSASALTAVELHVEGGPVPSVQHWDHFTSTTSITPGTPGMLDAIADSTIEGFRLQQTLPNGIAPTISARRTHTVVGLDGLARERVVTAFQAVAAAVRTARDTLLAADRPAAKAAGLARLHAMLTAAHGLLTGGRLTETLDDFAFSFGGLPGVRGTATIAFAADAPQDELTSSLTLGLDQLEISALPPDFAAYLPQHILLRPSISNVSAAALTKLATDMTAPGAAGKPPAADVAALFSHGGIALGLDEASLVVGGARFTGAGKFIWSGPNSVSGQAEISAEGLDALIAAIQTTPMLEQAVPVLVFMKGIAKPVGDRWVWQVAVAGGKVLVNGVDLSKLAAGMR